MCNRELYFYSLLLFPVGPVYIYSKNNDNIYYLKADAKSGCMVSTNRKEDASQFYLKLNENPKYPEEFFICYFLNRHLHLDLRRYLHAPDCTSESNHGSVQYKDVCFLLKSSIRDNHQHPVSLSAWMSGKEACYIRCARRWGKAYIAVTPPSPSCSTPLLPSCSIPPSPSCSTSPSPSCSTPSSPSCSTPPLPSCSIKTKSNGSVFQIHTCEDNSEGN